MQKNFGYNTNFGLKSSELKKSFESVNICGQKNIWVKKRLRQKNLVKIFFWQIGPKILGPKTVIPKKIR